MSTLFEPMSFACGRTMKNRFMLAPLTNTQSHPDGKLSDEEHRWLTLRAQGGFGLTMTCAAHVQRIGQGFPGQLGIFDDEHLPGLRRLAQALKAAKSLGVVQLHHAGMRSPKDLIGEAPVAPTEDQETGARALTVTEVEGLATSFIGAAVRAEQAGFDGVELHGAHGYILSQFISPLTNSRSDRYGGSLENRTRIVFDIIDGIRARCKAEFILGIRLSAERFGLQLDEIRDLAQTLMSSGKIDFLDMSLWDVFKEPAEQRFQGRTLLSYFTDLDRGETRLGAAGMVRSPEEARRALAAGMDFVLLGRAAILHHDFPNLMAANPNFGPVSLPVTADHLRAEGLSDRFIAYMAKWQGFVEG